MSVLFTSFYDEAIFLCADKFAATSITEEAHTALVSKIEKWTPTIAVGGTGNLTLCDLIKSAVRAYIKENGLDTFTLEEIADLFAQCYYAVVDTRDDMPQGVHGEFVVAGTLSNGKLGVIQVLVADNTADVETFEATETLQTLIFAPADMTNDECNQLLKRAIRNANKKKPGHQDFFESAHRKAVRYVSECSKWVGPKSDYIVITPDTTK